MTKRKADFDSKARLAADAQRALDRLAERGIYPTARRLGVAPLTVERLQYGGTAPSHTVAKIDEAIRALPEFASLAVA